MVAAGVIAVGAWLWLTTGSLATANSSSTASPASPHRSTPATAPDLSKSGGESIGVIARGTPLTAKQYLDAAPNKSLALFALWRLYGGTEYFNALKERVTLDPQAAVLVAIELRRQKREPADYVEDLRKGAEAFPGDVMLGFSLAGTEAALGNHESALAGLRRIADAGEGDFGAADRQRAMRDWLIANGTPENAAWKIAARNEEATQFAMAAIIQSNNAAIRHVTAVGTPEARLQLASDIFSLADRLNPTEDIFEDQNRSMRALELTALNMFPPNTAYGDKGQTTAQRIAEIRQDFGRQDHFIDSQLQPFLKTASPDIYMEFQQRRERQGLSAAFAWVQQKLAPPKKAP
jgi:hypothetical protein